MAITKSQIFEKHHRSLADLAKALSHPARIAIIETLAEKQSCICGEIVDELPLAQATVSQHLKALKEAGLIKGEIEGVRSCYCINWDKIANLKTAMTSLFDRLEDFRVNNSCC